MATFNGARWLEAQLDSFAAQTRLPDELVITDDGSTDGTAEVVASFAGRAAFPVHFVTNPKRLGYNGNFARAIALTRGDLIFVSDQDDVWYPQKIAQATAMMERAPECLCVVNDQMIADSSGSETGGTVLGNVRAMGRPDNWYGPGCCTAFSRRLMQVLEPMPGDIVAYDHWINALADAMGVRRIVEEPLQLYRRHDSNASGSVFARERPGLRHLFQAARRDGASAAIRDKVMEIDALLARLSTPPAVRLAAPDALSAGTVALQAERADYAARASVVERSRLRRLFPILRLLTRGGYRRFSGPMTAIKDLVT